MLSSLFGSSFKQVAELYTSQGCTGKQSAVVGGNLTVCILTLPVIWEGFQLKPSEPFTLCVPHVMIVLVDINPPLLPYVLTAFDLTCVVLSKEVGGKLC